VGEHPDKRNSLLGRLFRKREKNIMTKNEIEPDWSNRSHKICRKMYNYINKAKVKPDENGFKRIPRSRLLNQGTARCGDDTLEPNMYMALSYLVKFGFLEIDENYEVGKFSKGYKILKDWRSVFPSARKSKQKKEDSNG
jgi:hypothetical protein